MIPNGRRRTAVLTLAALAVLAALALAYPPRRGAPGPFVTEASRPTDARMFASVAERVAAGDDYYATMHDALRRGDYPTGSVFNWRTPLHLRAIAAAPWWAARAALTALLIALFTATMASSRGNPVLGWAAGGMQMGLLVLQSAPDAVYISEIWAGALVGLSVAAFGARLGGLGVALGLAALFVRELAAPYCVVCVALAARRQDWRHCAVWLGGGIAYAAYYAWHVTQVMARLTAADLPPATGWLSFGGLPFLQSTLRQAGWLAVAPRGATVVALVVIAAALVRPRTPAHVRGPSAAFAAFFLVAGLPVNDYWGWLAAPVWAMAIGHGAVAIGELVREASGRQLTASSAAAPGDTRASRY